MCQGGKPKSGAALIGIWVHACTLYMVVVWRVPCESHLFRAGFGLLVTQEAREVLGWGGVGLGGL